MRESRRRGREGTSVGGEGALVIFGSSGNLATTRIIPAVLSLRRKSLVSRRFVILGVDSRLPEESARASGYRFVRGDLRSRNTFSALGRQLGVRTGDTVSPVIFYLATKPELFSEIVRRLKEEGLNRSKFGRRKIMVEKPFGVDLESAQALESTLRSAFPLQEIFRVDHFLGKVGTEQIQRARFSTPRLEQVWNRRFIDHVQIMADEDSDVGARGTFYDSTGVVRDMVQNHLLQLLCLVAMEPPKSPGPAGVAKSKARVLGAMQAPRAGEVIWGQYRGYDQAKGVRRNTRTPTFAAMKVAVENSRWTGVPFYLRTGKALARTATEVVVVFRGSTPLSKEAPGGLSSLRIRIDPRAGATVEANGKVRAISSEAPEPTADEYESLLLEAMNGDQSRFVDARFNPLSWRILKTQLDDWEGPHSPKPAPYEPGSWGPSAADGLLAAEGRFWRDGRPYRSSG